MSWEYLQELTVDGAVQDSNTGEQVYVYNNTFVTRSKYSLDGNDYYEVNIFEKDSSGNFQEINNIVTSKESRMNNNNFGNSMAIYKDLLLVSDICGNHGVVYLYDYNHNEKSWIHNEDVELSVGGDTKFGCSVAIYENTIVVGEKLGGAQTKGAAYVYEYDGSTLTQISELTATHHSSSNDEFGYTVVIHKNTIVVSAPNDRVITNGSTFNDGAGSIHVFTKDISGNWPNTGVRITASNASVFHRFGRTMALHDDIIVVGDKNADTDNPYVKGAIYIYTKDTNNNWSEERLTGSNIIPLDQFGSSVSINNGTIAVGVPNDQYGEDDENGNNNKGRVFIYKKDESDNWVEQVINDINGEADDKFGKSVTIQGSTLVVGAFQKDISGNIDQGKIFVYYNLSNLNDISNESDTVKYNIRHTEVNNYFENNENEETVVLTGSQLGLSQPDKEYTIHKYEDNKEITVEEGYNYTPLSGHGKSVLYTFEEKIYKVTQISLVDGSSSEYELLTSSDGGVTFGNAITRLKIGDSVTIDDVILFFGGVEFDSKSIRDNREERILTLNNNKTAAQNRITEINTELNNTTDANEINSLKQEKNVKENEVNDINLALEEEERINQRMILQQSIISQRISIIGQNNNVDIISNELENIIINLFNKEQYDEYQNMSETESLDNINTQSVYRDNLINFSNILNNEVNTISTNIENTDNSLNNINTSLNAQNIQNLNINEINALNNERNRLNQSRNTANTKRSNIESRIERLELAISDTNRMTTYINTTNNKILIHQIINNIDNNLNNIDTSLNAQN